MRNIKNYITVMLTLDLETKSGTKFAKERTATFINMHREEFPNVEYSRNLYKRELGRGTNPVNFNQWLELKGNNWIPYNS